MPVKICTAKQQMRAAQTFTFFSIIAVLLLPAIIPMLLWIAASIFVYAAAAHHPNPRVCEFLKYSGYRFYGVVGALVAGWIISPLVGIPTINQDVFSLPALLVSLLGAIVLLGVVNLVRRDRIR